MGELTVPIIARYGSLEVTIGTLTIPADSEPIVTTDPERVRLAQSAIRAVADGP